MRTLVPILLVGACSLPGNHYGPSPDARVPGAPDAASAIDAAPAADAPADAFRADAPPQALVIVASMPTLTLVEGDSTTFSVTLSGPPVAPVTVDGMTAAGKVMLAPATLTFDAASFATPQIIDVAAPRDPDGVSETDTITLSAAGLQPTTVPVSVIDNDDQSILTSLRAITIDEGSAKAVSIWLSIQPAADVAVAVTVQDPTLDTVDRSVLVFTPVNYTIAQQVQIAALYDGNTVDESNTVMVSSAGLPSVIIAVTNHDTGP